MKKRASERNEGDCLRDISDGACYQQLFSDGGFLSGTENFNITSIFNMDGLSLYSSSRIELWPIFMTVNELEPQKRFARHNIILSGIWQGRGKPPFKQFLHAFATEMNKLFDNGFEVKYQNQTFCVKLAVLCAVADLPAKAGILNMTLFNGSEACITCTEPGRVVK